MEILKSVVILFFTMYGARTFFAILAVVTVAAINEAINQLAFGRGKVKPWAAALIASITVTLGILAWNMAAGIDFVLGATILLFSFFPVLLAQYWIAQRLLKEPISALIARFSSSWAKETRIGRVHKIKAKRLHIGGEVYYSYLGDDGKPIVSPVDPNEEAKK